ncbi:unnamed protein product [Effrenium voratum]|nr:unnamed protein product [Effrenium voratum]CAJ1433318.1 unnamed protein product [Effrenium voratum]
MRASVLVLSRTGAASRYRTEGTTSSSAKATPTAWGRAAGPKRASSAITPLSPVW